MKVLVTGASGFIGSALCDSLLDRGDSVVGLTRDPSRSRRANPQVTWHRWDPMRERPPSDAFAGVDGVVNLIGETINQRWTEASKQRIMESRRTSTRNLVAAIAGLERRPAVLVNQSAVGIYGDHGDEEVDESGGLGESFDAEVLRELEAAAREAEASGLRLVIVRSGPVLDPGHGLLGEMITPFRLGVGGPVAGGRQYVSWIHIADEVAVLVWALDEEGVTGVVNATAPRPVTLGELSKALGRALNRPAVMPVPGLFLDLKYGREFGKVLRGGQRVIPARAREHGYEFRFGNVDDALDDLL